MAIGTRTATRRPVPRPDTLARRGALLLCALGMVAGCATAPSADPGLALIREGRTLEGLAVLEAASRAAPGNGGLRAQWLTQRAQALADRLARADALAEAGRLDDARTLLHEALAIAPRDERATAALRQADLLAQVRPDLDRGSAAVDARDLAAAEAALAAAQSRAPALAAVDRLARRVDALRGQRLAELRHEADAASPLLRRVSLQVRDANLRATLDALARSVGLNLVFDNEVRRDLRVSVSVQDAPLADVLDLVLMQAQLARRTVNANSLFVYPATEARLREHQELDVRSFHVAHGDPKQVAAALRTLLKLRDVVVDERGGTLLLREPPAVLEVAERIVRAHDRADPEVMLELDVLEVSRDRLSNIGVRLPDSIGISVPPGRGPDGASTIGDLRALGRDQLLVTPIGVGVNLRLADTDANLLASPRIRARHRQTARVMIGDKVPVITNTVTPLQSGNSVVTGAIQYLDVGIKLQVEPEVYPDGQVGIRLNLEVSNIAREIAGPAGSLAYQIGTRNAETVLRLRDGETQILAGLISDQVRSTASRVPGVGQLPTLGRLFSSVAGNDTKTEIVLSITPRIVRPVTALAPGIEQFPSGTEAQVRPRPLGLEAPGAPRPAGVPPAPPLPLPLSLPPEVAPPAPSTPTPAAGAPATDPRPLPGAAPEPPQAAPEAPAVRRSRPPVRVDVDWPPLPAR